MFKNITPQKLDAVVGNLRQYLSLFFPLLLIGFSSALFVVIEKVLLARLSIEEVEVAVTVAYICQIFQITGIALGMMAQIAVARWVGEQNWKAIGPGIWQFIWFSLFSTAIVVPLGILYGNFFFEKIPIKELALPYYHFFLWINFLFPLGAVLSCFYLGQGKTKLIMIATIACQLLKISVAIPLILGWKSIPSLGLKGAAISTLIAQGALCIFLFALFIRAKNQENFHSRIWTLQLKLFWSCIKPGLLRAINRILTLTSWLAIVFMMSHKGESYLLILSIGGAFSLFLPFVGDAICQSGAILASQMIGAKKYDLLKSVSLLSLSTASVFILLTAIPLVFIPNITFATVFPKIILDPQTIQRVLFGIWICFIFYTFSCIGISYVLAFKDMAFSVLMGVFNWFNGFLLMYLFLQKMQIPANWFWLALSCMHITTTLIYYLRAKKLCSHKWLDHQRMEINSQASFTKTS